MPHSRNRLSAPINSPNPLVWMLAEKKNQLEEANEQLFKAKQYLDHAKAKQKRLSIAVEALEKLQTT